MATLPSPIPLSLRREALPPTRGAKHGSLFRFVALLLLIVQFGVIAHRIEHYFVPEQMECGEDSCAAFAPATGATAPVVYLPPLLLVFYFLRFWTVCATAVVEPSDRLGFRAHAPPV